MEKRGGEFRGVGLSANLTSLLTENAAAHVGLIAEIEDMGQRMIVQEAFAGSLRGIWITCACAAGVAVLCSGFVSGKSLTRDHVETRTGVNNDEKKGGGAA